MLKIKEFINSPKKSGFAKEYRLNEGEVDILHTLLIKKLKGENSVEVREIVKDVFDEEKLKTVKSLIEKGLLDISFFEKKVPLLEIYSNKISLSPLFFELLEDRSGIEVTDTPYKSGSEFLKEQFDRVRLYKRLSALRKENSIASFKIKKEIGLIEKRIALRSKNSKNIFLIDFLKRYSLEKKEEIILFALLKEEFLQEDESLRRLETLLELISEGEVDKLENLLWLDSNSKLVSEGLVDFEESDFFSSSRIYFVSDEVLEGLSAKKMHKINHLVKNTIFELIEPDVNLEDLVLSKEIKKSIDTFLSQFNSDVLEKLKKWGIKDNIMSAKILFYGPAGTGKTVSAYAIANSLQKPVLSLDSSKILSAYVGESEKNVRRVFDEYYEISEKIKNRPVLLLNEADQFLSSRSTHAISSADKMHNQMQNIFLEQIERFYGVLIATTNLIESLDEAFSRRFDFKVRFEKPGFNERVRLWEMKLPKGAVYEEGFDIKKLAKYSLTGAQIELVIKNTALKVAVRGDDVFRVGDFVEVIKKELSSGFDSYKEVGFGV